MKKPRVVMTITKEKKGYSATAKLRRDFIGTEGKSLEDLRKKIVRAVNLAAEEYGWVYTEEEIVLKPDLPSFFEFYKVLNAKALSERIGMNQSLLAQYISGHKKPSSQQLEKIAKGVRAVGRELSSVVLAF